MTERSFSSNDRQDPGRSRMRMSRSPSAAPAPRSRLPIRVVRASAAGIRNVPPQAPARAPKPVASPARAASSAPRPPRKPGIGGPGRRSPAHPGGPRRSTRQDIGIHFERTRDLALESRDDRKAVEKKKVTIPPLAPGDVRIVILGGVEEIGRNMAAVEYGNDIVIIDCGFMFKDDNTPGIDYILPDTTYLEDRKDKIRAMVITHGHLDHIGGIPYLIDKLGNPPIYARNLTAMIIKKRQDEFPHVPAIDLKIVETTDRVAFGDLAVRFFKVTHTIPDSMGVMVETPYGVIAHTGDLKLNHVGGVPTEEEEEEFGKIAKEKVLVLMADSTNCEKPGFSIPEPQVHRTIEGIIRDVRGRLIIATFASLLERIIAIIAYAEVMGKKVVIDGRSMKTNIELAEKAGMIHFKKGTLIPIEEMDQFPPDRIIMLVTGAQGDEFASLNRAAMKKHKYLKLREGDTVLFSSSVVPGNERAVQRLKDLLSRQGGRIVHYASSDVHSSGHANRDETMWIHTKVKPKFFIPLHGYHYFLRTHAEISVASGTPRDNIIIPDDGAIIEIRNKGEKMVRLPQSAPKEMIAVDGFSVGGMQEVVIRDRQMLAQEGIVVIVATVDMRSGKLMKSPDIVARGFVYVRESQDMLSQARLIVKKTVEDACGKGMKGVNFEYVKEDVRDRVGKFLFQKTNKQP
ncbi:MAG TPA: RNase J family beta-CASP ribonuclease, partial [Candidatus Paceibacterota bacterium]|nr:RNase J family beta-CASP ribonuclease [Candidatus Paceibacterota bacterium]